MLIKNWLSGTYADIFNSLSMQSGCSKESKSSIIKSIYLSLYFFNSLVEIKSNNDKNLE